jgi:hypothetical protein
MPVGPALGATSPLEAFWELERFLSEAGTARLALAELERGSESRGRELLRLSLQAHLDSRGDGDIGEGLLLDSPDGPVRLTHKACAYSQPPDDLRQRQAHPHRLWRPWPRLDPPARLRARAPGALIQL